MSTLSAISHAGQIANVAERAFAHQVEAAGKTWLYQPRQFMLPAPYRSYRPDFYVIEDGCFYEIVGTRQAYSYRREQLAAFRTAYPHLRLEVFNGAAWKNGASRPRVERVKQYYRSNKTRTLKRLKRLAAAKPESPASALLELMKKYGLNSLTGLARMTGVGYERIRFASVARAGSPAVRRTLDDLLNALTVPIGAFFTGGEKTNGSPERATARATLTSTP